MKLKLCLTLMLPLLLLVCISLVACEKEKKQGKLLVSQQEFVIRQDTENTFTIDAKGKIKNVGDVDVKNVLVTGFCRSCSGAWGVGQWQASPDIDRMPQQTDTINYIPAGGEESFSFTEVADYLYAADRKKPELPEKLEVVIESFETVE